MNNETNQPMVQADFVAIIGSLQNENAMLTEVSNALYDKLSAIKPFPPSAIDKVDEPKFGDGYMERLNEVAFRMKMNNNFLTRVYEHVKSLVG